MKKLKLPVTVAALEQKGTRFHASSCGRLRWKQRKVKGQPVLEAVCLYGPYECLCPLEEHTGKKCRFFVKKLLCSHGVTVLVTNKLIDSKLHREYASIANRNNGQAHVVKRGRGAGGGFGATGELGPLIVITHTKLQMGFSATCVPHDGAHVLLAVESIISDMCIAQSMPAKLTVEACEPLDMWQSMQDCRTQQSATAQHIGFWACISRRHSITKPHQRLC